MKAKITSVEYIDSYDSQYGTFYNFKVKYNGVSGIYTSKSKEQNKFVVDQEAEFEEETKESQSGKYTKVKPVSSQSSYSGGSNSGFTKKPVQYASFAVSYTKDLIIAGKLEFNQLEPAATKIFNLMKKLDGQ